MKKDTYAILVAVWCVGALATTSTRVKLVCLIFALLYFILQCFTKEQIMDFIKKVTSKVLNVFTQEGWEAGKYTWEYIDDTHLEQAYFTQAEKQQLKAILSERIFQLECIKAHDLSAARGLKRGAYKDTAAEYYKSAEKTQKKINTLAALQKKIKHTLATRG